MRVTTRMSELSRKQKQWLWFIGLGVLGIVGALLLGFITRLLIKISIS